jgi:hypothetical protein
MAWTPAGRFAATNVADPPLTVPVPNAVPPSMNWTVPVAEAGTTEAVRVTLCPNEMLPLLAETVTMVEALATVWMSAAEVPEL